MLYENKKGKCILYIESKDEMEKIHNSNSPGKGQTIDIIMLPESVKDWKEKYPDLYMSWIPMLKQKTGKILYYNIECAQKLNDKPKTLDEAVEVLLPRFEGMEEYIEKYDEDKFASFCHSQLSGGIGMKIRNEFGFWTKDTELYKHMVEVHKLEHPDSMSALILKHVYKKLKNKNV